VNENSYIPYPMYATKDMAASGSAAPVEAGTMDVVMSVSVTYLF
jgi:uncharacterized protein